MRKKSFNQFQKEVQNQKAKEPNPDNKVPLCNCDPISFRYPY